MCEDRMAVLLLLLLLCRITVLKVFEKQATLDRVRCTLYRYLLFWDCRIAVTIQG
jgi:hypothetical protein